MIEFNRHLHVAYIDINAAFDSVDRAALWKALQLIQDLHTGTTARVHVKNGLSAPFRTSSGVRQGCILAPAWFCCAIDWRMRQCTGKLGVDVGHGTFTDLGYSNDGALFTAHPDNWNEVLTDYEAAANTLGLQRFRTLVLDVPQMLSRWSVRQWSQ